MKNIKFYNIKTRFVALTLATTILGSTAVGCSKKEEKVVVPTTPNKIVTTVDDTSNKIDKLVPEVSEEVVDNAAIMLLLDLIAKKDENGKISADLISELKAKIDVDDMINEFNSFLDILGSKTRKEDKVSKISSVLPEELKNDKLILSNIETILENIIKYSKEGNKDGVISEFNKIYTLFVEEKELDVNGVKLEIRDLTFPSRAVANKYAETAGYYAKKYIKEDKLKKLDERTNDQNNKAYIKSKLEILNNQMEEKSIVDVVSMFNKKYEEVTKLTNGKVKLSNDTIKNIVNYANLKYLDGDQVSTKDKNLVVGEYTDEKVTDAIIGIEAINKYNQNNQKSIIPLSALLVEEYLKTETGKTDKLALDFVQFNSIKLLNKVDSKTDYETLSNNPYFKNVYKYFTKQNFTHTVKDNNGKNINNNIEWQLISDGTNFINYQVILYSLNELPKVKNIDSYIDKTETNLEESIQYIQNTITDECKKVDVKEYIKTK